MGTRNLTVVKVDNKIKMAQYCQWDGYPTGQGIQLAKFLKKYSGRMLELSERVRNLSWMTEEEIAQTYKSCGIEPNNGFISMDESEKMKMKFPHLHRDCGGADVLKMILTGRFSYQRSKDFNTLNISLRDLKVEKLVNNLDFEKDTLFCEFSYYVDLDDETVTVKAYGEEVAKYNFDSFTPKAMKELTKALEKEEDD